MLGIPFQRVRDGRLGPLVRAAARAGSTAVPDWLRWSASGDPVDVLIGLLLAGERVPNGRLAGVLDADVLAAMESMSLVDVDGEGARCPFHVYPIDGRYLVTDPWDPPPGINPVSCLYPETYLMAHFLERRDGARRILDLCTGSGVHALLVHHRDRPYREKMAERLGELARWDVDIRAVPFPFHPVGDLDPAIGRFELGLISIRRHRGGGVARYEHGPAADLFPLFSPERLTGGDAG